jgi:hypothetical protein
LGCRYPPVRVDDVVVVVGGGGVVGVNFSLSNKRVEPS